MKKASDDSFLSFGVSDETRLSTYEPRETKKGRKKPNRSICTLDCNQLWKSNLLS